jgi:dTDP-4-dehydrorhamnose 3,5-epimerase
MIGGVILKPLKVFCDDRGFLMEVLRADDPFFRGFGQTTYTVAYPGTIKAFHWHRRQDDLWFVAAGMAQVVLYDLREASPTFRQTDVYYLGDHNRQLLVIPTGVAHGYRVLGNDPVLLLYHTTESYNPADPDEERLAYNDETIGFDWTTKMK